MKLNKILSIVLAVAMILSTMTIGVFAADDVVEVQELGTSYTTLQAAFNAVADSTIELHIFMLKDVEEDVVINSPLSNIKFYMNGHTLKGQIKIDFGSVTINGQDSYTAQGHGAIVNTGVDGKYPIYCSSGLQNSSHIYINNVDINATEANGTAIYLDRSALDIQLLNGVVVNGGIEVKNGTFIAKGTDYTTNPTKINGTITKTSPGAISIETGVVFLKDPTAILTKFQTAAYDDTAKTWTISQAKPEDLIAGLATEGGAYLIEDADDLVAFHNGLSLGGTATFDGKVFKITKDIDLTGKVFVTTGTKDNRFAGTLDGQDNTLKNLVIDGAGKDYAGLIGSLALNGKVINVNVENATVTGASFAAVLVGQSRATAVVEGCSVSGNIDVDCTGEFVAGVVGCSSAGGVEKCSVSGTGTISGGSKVGGIVGNASSGSVTNNSVEDVTITGDFAVGGIAGYVVPNNTAISGNEVTDADIAGGESTGLVVGLVFENGKGMTVSNNAATESTINGAESSAIYGSIGTDATSSKITVLLNGRPYGSLKDAVAASADGDVITLLEDAENADVTISKDITLDLGGNTINEAYIIVTGDVTIQNGKIVNDDEPYPLVVQNGGVLTVEGVDIKASKSDRAVWVRGNNSVLNLNAGTSILATKGVNNTKTSLIAGVYTDTNTTVNVNGATITVDTPNNKAVGIYGNYTNADVNMTAGKISTSGANYSYGINVDGDITISGGEIVTNEKRYGYSSGVAYGNNYALVTATGDVTVTGGKITTNGYSGYMVNVGRTYSSNDQEINISDVEFENVLTETDKTVGGHKPPVLIWEGSASDVTATISGGTFEGVGEALLRGENTDLEITGGTFPVDVSKYVPVGTSVVKTDDGLFIVADADDVPDLYATELKVVVKEVSDTEADIYIESTDGKVINRLTSAALKFYVKTFTKNDQDEKVYDTESKVNYTLAPATDIAITADLSEDDAYAFNYTGDKTADFTASAVKLATVTLEGYAMYEFGVAEYDLTKVSTTSLSDNIEKTYVPAPAANQGKLVIGTDAVIDGEIKEVTRDIKVVVEFNNEIKNQTAEYTDMLITLVGSNGYTDDASIGSDDIAITVDANGKVSAAATFEDVAVPYRYTVTVSGAGYRTASYTNVVGEGTNEDDALVLKFWNNVKDAPDYIEGQLDRAEMTKNFLAGDIVKDNNINKYDLSAVVSYFGTREVVNKVAAGADLNKYDLNRDGNIDSEDIAYVLVSFGE